MEYLISIFTIGIFVIIYVLGYYLNSKTKKPENCKEIDCQGCKINCNKRG